MVLLAPRIVPEIDGSPTYTEISLRWIDVVGDLRADVSIIDSKATDAQIENVVNRMVNASTASLYAVHISAVYAGVKSKDNAVEEVRMSVQDNITYHSKGPARTSRRAFVPAPKKTLFFLNTETPNPGHITLINMMAAWDALWAGAFVGASLRFSERRETGKKKDL